jgi:hypothetical protein
VESLRLDGSVSWSEENVKNEIPHKRTKFITHFRNSSPMKEGNNEQLQRNSGFATVAVSSNK